MDTVEFVEYDWHGCIKWYYDFDLRLYFVDPMYREEFLEEPKRS